MSANGMTEHARNNQRLIIGPWTHGYDLKGVVGEVDFRTGCGPATTLGSASTGSTDGSRRTQVAPRPDWPPVQLFVMGENRWRAEQEWPLARTKYTDFYLRGDGSANSPKGDGALTTEPPPAGGVIGQLRVRPARPRHDALLPRGTAGAVRPEDVRRPARRSRVPDAAPRTAGRGDRAYNRDSVRRVVRARHRLGRQAARRLGQAASRKSYATASCGPDTAIVTRPRRFSSPVRSTSSPLP